MPIDKLLLCILALSSIVMTSCVDTVELKGKGATFPAPIYSRWIALYNRQNEGIRITYEPIGSGGGIQAITKREADFGASDALLKKSEKRRLPGELLQIPTVIGPVVIAYNLPHIQGNLVLSSDVIVDIYLNKIKQWNDPRISQLNPNLNLPSLLIHVAHRSDSSGTTYIFSDYLTAVSAEWADRVGRGKSLFWPTGDKWAGEGNDGVAHKILLEPGGLGYVELKYAENAGLSYATIINQEGNPVKPSIHSVQKAEENTTELPGTFIKPSIVNAPGKESYPIAGFTYILIYQDLRYLSNPIKERALLKFMSWILNDGQKFVEEMHYTPLPEQLRLESIKLLESIQWNSDQETTKQP